MTDIMDTGTPDTPGLDPLDVAAAVTGVPPSADTFMSVGRPPPAVPAGLAGQMQLGLGPLMGIGRVAPQGRYSAQGLREGALDSLKNTCLGSGTKVPEEVAAVKAALEASIAVREDELISALCPAHVLGLLQMQAFAAVDAGLPLPTVVALWPEILNPEHAESLAAVQTWRKARVGLRLFSRFESQPDAPGLAALKAWQEHDTATTIAAARGETTREPLLRDAMLDSPDAMALHLASVNEQRAKVIALRKPGGSGSGSTGTGGE